MSVVQVFLGRQRDLLHYIFPSISCICDVLCLIICHKCGTFRLLRSRFPPPCRSLSMVAGSVVRGRPCQPVVKQHPKSFDDRLAHWAALASFIQSIDGYFLRISHAIDRPQLTSVKCIKTSPFCSCQLPRTHVVREYRDYKGVCAASGAILQRCCVSLPIKTTVFGKPLQQVAFSVLRIRHPPAMSRVCVFFAIVQHHECFFCECWCALFYIH